MKINELESLKISSNRINVRLIILLIYLIFNEKRNKEFKILMKCLIKFKRIQLIFHDFFYLYKKI